jgi:hypothetical protein
MSTEMSLFSAGNDLIRAVSSQYEVDLILNSSFATKRLAFNKNRFGLGERTNKPWATLQSERTVRPLEEWSDGVMHLFRCSITLHSTKIARAGTQASGLGAQRSVTPLKVS